MLRYLNVCRIDVIVIYFVWDRKSTNVEVSVNKGFKLLISTPIVG